MSARSIKKNPIPEVPKHFNDRNTREWCRGKKGVEHSKIWRDDETLRSSHHRLGLPWREKLVCRDCGKEFNSRVKRFQVGDLIRVLREKADKTQEDLAREIGVSLLLLTSFESGQSQPRLVELEKLSIALGVRLEVRFAEVPVRISDHEPGYSW